MDVFSHSQTLSRGLIAGICFLLMHVFGSPSAHAGDPLCAEVKIEILQELSLERQGFDARMAINNGHEDLDMTDVAIDVSFFDRDGNPVEASSNPNSSTAKFYIRIDTLEQISSITNGTVSRSSTATIHWLIIPTVGAGGQLPEGTLYLVGARLAYTLGSEHYDFEVVPDFITVRPQPKLRLDYFLPHDVFGDNPLTPNTVEAPEPFPLAVRVQNTGYGSAHNVSIDSGQPKIVDDQQGLLVGFQIMGSQVNGQDQSKSFKVAFGDIEPGESGVARWILEASLSGRFEDFGANFSHADELGGKLTSLIDGLATHTLVHEVLVDLPGRDTALDFLSADDGITRVFETNGLDSDVQDLSASSSFTYDSGNYLLTHPPAAGFVYFHFVDPRNGNAQIASVTREDGKLLLPQNAWIYKTYDKIANKWEYFIGIFDDSPYAFSYRVRFKAKTGQGDLPPVIAYLSPKVLQAGNFMGFIVRASDPNGSRVQLSCVNLPFNAAFVDHGNGTGSFTWIPTSGQLGDYSIEFQASDGLLSSSAYASLTVGGTSVNHAPLAADLPLTPTEDIPYRGYLSADDPDGNTLSFSVGPASHGTVELLNAETGEFRYTPQTNFDGSDSFSFSASDGSLSAQALVSVRMRPINDPPSLASAIPDQQDQVDTAFTYVMPPATFTDPDGDVLAYSVVDLPSWLGFDPVSGTFTGTPTSADTGTSTLQITATDPFGEQASDSFLVTVTLGADGQISGNCFVDLDRDGVYDAGEPGLAALAVYLDLNGNGSQDQEEPATTTDAQGHFAIGGLASGSYILRDEKPSDYVGYLAEGQDFESPQLLDAASAATALALIDLDGNGLADLVSLTATTSQVTVRLATTPGQYAAGVNYTVGQEAVALTAADFDNDGDLDLAVLNRTSGNLTLLANQGNGSLTASNLLNLDQPSLFNAADFDGDGNADLVVFEAGTGLLKLFIAQDNGTFSAGQTLDPGAAVSQLISADLDAAQGPDLILATASGLLCYHNNGSASFAPVATLTQNAPASALVAADLNGDDHLDLLSASASSTQLTWYSGDGSGAFAQPRTVEIGISASLLAVFDVNGDGTQDLIASDGISAQLTYLQNADFAQFRTARVLAAGFPAQTLAHGDLDGDGDLDLAIGADTSLALALNRQRPVVTLAEHGSAEVNRPAVLKPGFIEGFVFDDINGNGSLDEGESALAGRTLFLDLNENAELDTDEPLASSDENGEFVFVDVEAGSYQLLLVELDGWQTTSPLDQGYTVAVSPGELVGGQDFGSAQMSLGDLLVTSLIDSPDTNPGDGIVADSNGNASLRAAIMEANALPGPNTIILAAGSYLLSLNGDQEDLSLSGDLDILDDLTLTGQGADLTLIDAAGIDRVLHVGPGVTLSLSGLALTGGDTGDAGSGLQISGGAVLNEGSINLSAVAVYANLAEGQGGAIYSAGSLTMDKSTLSGNESAEGGGLAIASGAVASLINSTISGNLAQSNGGAALVEGSLSALHVTLAENLANLGQGGGIYVASGSASLANSIVASNSAATDPDLSGAFTSMGANLIGDLGSATGLMHGTNGDQVGNASVPLDPGLEALAYNGGTTETHRLLLGSSAIDAAFASSVVDDQRGVARPLDGDGDGNASDDIGAVEGDDQSPMLQVSSPNGGESLVPGEIISLTWTTRSLGGNVRIEYSLNGGAAWTNIAANTANDGQYNWSVPAIGSTQGLLRITSNVDTNIKDLSDGAFTVLTPSLTLSSPNGGQVLTPGAIIGVGYAVVNFKGGVKLEISFDGGSVWEMINDNLGNGPVINWRVPAHGSELVVFRVTSRYFPAFQDSSDGVNTILTPSLSLTSHDGGQIMTPGATTPIGYSIVNLAGGVSLEVSYDGGSVWSMINATLNNGPTYIWNIPAISSDQVKFRVTSIYLPELSDTSEGNNTILAPTLTAPNGGESVEIGNPATISWNQASFPGNVSIDLSRDSGATWASIVASTENIGTYSWVPSGATTTTCRVRIQSVDMVTISDSSDADFSLVTVPYLMTYPNGGESLIPGDIASLTWASSLGGNVRLEYTLNGGTTWTTIASNTGNDGQYNWQVPAAGTTNALFRVSSSTNASLSDTSNGPFTILTPSVTLNSHNGGVVMTPGGFTTFNYSVVNFKGGVKLEISYDGGTQWNVIKSSLGNGPTYSWLVPETGSTQVLFRISSVYFPVLTDTSEAVNTILTPTVSLNTHNGDVVMTPGTTTAIGFGLNNLLGGVALEVSYDGGAAWQTIDNYPGNGPTYSWVVTANPSNQVFFRVKSLTLPTLLDVSESANTIQ